MILNIQQLLKILDRNNTFIITTFKTNVEGKEGYVHILEKEINTEELIKYKNVKLGPSHTDVPEHKCQVVFIEGIENNSFNLRGDTKCCL